MKSGPSDPGRPARPQAEPERERRPDAQQDPDDRSGETGGREADRNRTPPDTTVRPGEQDPGMGSGA